MAQQLLELRQKLEQGTANFADVIAFIDEYYTHTPTAFQNGQQYNSAEQNQGSAKVLSFAQLNHLDQVQTLQLFAEHYQAVLKTPEGTDHQNIRQFMQKGWQGVRFNGQALTEK